ncbi:hypothetical protein E3N88_37723 [Mikania micrantha]|uniref:Leucine-rich repeat-containing N-terminal plant-type domain-containing protein n=1 Tax=Mikania micrantha TaxID=192012 RepID=A0A5N6LRW2_9ASTR|nr:hypothetical protein E3N88_37723 [Mikania micrantha]
MTGGRTNVDGKKTELEVTETGGFLFLAFIREFECVLRAQSNKWHGVGCGSRNGHVVKLDLRSHWKDFNEKWLEGSFESLEYLNLSHSSFSEGVVPHHLGNLSRLQVLDLRSIFIFDDGFGNFLAPIVDDLRWVSSLSSLRYLDLSGISIGNHTDWFHPVNMLPSLLTLNLADTGINIPSTQFVNFTSLNSIDLSDNDINSTIPIWLSNLTGLMHLNLKFNKFHGKIPDFIGTFSTLASIDLSVNSFYTSMPDLLCNLSSLFHLDLSDNIFSGPLSKLKNLDLSRNSFVGVLSETHFTNLKNLIYLDLSSNWFALNFSSRWIPLFQLQVFRASSCSNIGPYFPNWLHTQTHLQQLDLSNSSIRGTLPEWFDSILSHILHLDLSNNQIGGKMPLFHFDTSVLTTLKMNSNKFEGTLAAFPSNVNHLDLSNNLLSGELPQTGETMNLTLEVVNLSKNRFTGNIPVDLCRASYIQVLDLSQNKLFGRLPECLGNLSGLIAMDLSNNTIIGVVPSSLGSFTQLTTLHLHNNRLEGKLPLSLQNLTNLVTMDIGYNFLVGDIPFWSGERLLNLRILNLQSNKFTGKIPLQFCQLNAIQHLNLAQNNIIGTIPPCFANLSGMITDQSSIVYRIYNYEENIQASIKGIQSCKGDNSSYDHVGKVEAQDEDEDEDFWLYIGMGAGFVVGFIGLLGSLHFIRSWRVAYFEMLENFYTSILVNLACLRRTFVSRTWSSSRFRLDIVAELLSSICCSQAVVLCNHTYRAFDSVCRGDFCLHSGNDRLEEAEESLALGSDYQQYPCITTVDPALILNHKIYRYLLGS